MSQDWVSNLYTTGTVGDTTLSNMELMFATLRSSFSGSAAPSNAVNGNLWYDTDTHLLKLYRNAAWAGVLVGSSSFKMWVYANAAEDGWSVDSSVTDKVLALKGGSLAYNINGGNTGGSFTYTGFSNAAEASHYHSMQGHVHGKGSTPGLDPGAWPTKNFAPTGNTGGPSSSNTGAGSSHNHAISHTGDDRPAGAVGIMVYPNTT